MTCAAATAARSAARCAAASLPTALATAPAITVAISRPASPPITRIDACPRALPPANVRSWLHLRSRREQAADGGRGSDPGARERPRGSAGPSGRTVATGTPASPAAARPASGPSGPRRRSPADRSRQRPVRSALRGAVTASTAGAPISVNRRAAVASCPSPGSSRTQASRPRTRASNPCAASRAPSLRAAPTALGQLGQRGTDDRDGRGLAARVAAQRERERRRHGLHLPRPPEHGGGGHLARGGVDGGARRRRSRGAIVSARVGEGSVWRVPCETLGAAERHPAGARNRDASRRPGRGQRRSSRRRDAGPSRRGGTRAGGLVRVSAAGHSGAASSGGVGGCQP